VRNELSFCFEEQKRCHPHRFVAHLRPLLNNVQRRVYDKVKLELVVLVKRLNVKRIVMLSHNGTASDTVHLKSGNQQVP
jgi:hypothetical protein